jgi:hypothetical protein
LDAEGGGPFGHDAGSGAVQKVGPLARLGQIKAALHDIGAIHI